MTQEQFNQDYGRIAMPKPFAHDGLITPIVDIGDSTHPVNFADGFPSEYSAPHSQGGKYVTRGEFNAIGNLATRNDFYKACGGLNTFNAALASKIGGYPKGAVLQLLDNNVLKYVISLVDNNTVNFNTAGVDGVNWMFCYESKHEEEEREGFLEHIELTDITVDLRYSINVYAKYSPKDGFINIRNVRFEFGGTTFSTNIDNPSFIGSGIALKAFENPEVIHPMFAGADASNAWPGWRIARVLSTGIVYYRTAGGPTMQLENFFGAVNVAAGTNVIPTTGLIAIKSGEYIVIDVVNGYSKLHRDNSNFSTSASDIKSLSFDIYII